MLIGLSGPAGCGKDTVADYLVKQYGFVKFSFSDLLYKEVSDAFNVPVEELQDRRNKDRPHPQLTARNCKSDWFHTHMRGEAGGLLPDWAADSAVDEYKFSPRWVLQHWGTEFRRHQDPEYWLKASDMWIDALASACRENDEPMPSLVNTSVRFPNEAEFIRSRGGEVWHLRRFADRAAHEASGVASGLDHVAEQGLEVLDGDKELFNSGTVEQLGTAVSLLLQADDPSALDDLDAKTVAYNSDETLNHSFMRVVECTACGALHAGVTEAYAKAEVDTFNNFLDARREEGKDTPKRADIAEYYHCAVCGGTEFKESEEHTHVAGKAASADLVPVIFKEQ